MRHARVAASFVLVLSCLAGFAKDKKKVLLPADVLQARTVLVVVDPKAGVDIEDPNANRLARVDVEQALMKWGRFSLANDASTANLIIVVSKGNGRIVQPTIGGIPNNNRPVVLEPTDSGGVIGARRGNNGNPGDPSNPQLSNPHPEVQAGLSQDTLAVYRNDKGDSGTSPLDAPAVWRSSTTDGLHSPDVPAVDEFRKLIAESEKQLAGKP